MENQLARMTEAHWRTPIKLWNQRELAEAFSRLNRLQTPFGENCDMVLVRRILRFDGYPIHAGLSYYPPQNCDYSVGLHPFNLEVFVPILGTGQAATVHLPVRLDFHTAEDINNVDDWEAKIGFDLLFKNGFVANGLMQVKETGDVSLMSYQRDKNTIYLPNTASNLAPTTITAYKY